MLTNEDKAILARMRRDGSNKPRKYHDADSADYRAMLAREEYRADHLALGSDRGRRPGQWVTVTARAASAMDAYRQEGTQDSSNKLYGEPEGC